MVSCADKEGKPNIVTIAWTGTICSDPAMVSISVRKERYSHKLISESGEFVINLTTEKDHLEKALNRVKKAQQNGARKCPTLWKHVNDLNTDISRKTAKEIVDFAVLYNADAIVFEYLDTQGKKKGKGNIYLFN